MPELCFSIVALCPANDSATSYCSIAYSPAREGPAPLQPEQPPEAARPLPEVIATISFLASRYWLSRRFTSARLPEPARDAAAA